MPSAREHQPSLTTSGDYALDIIDDFRSVLHDDTRMEELEVEFPDFTASVGAYGVALMNLSDNDAGAFKWRGAAVGMTMLKEQGIDHVIAPSAGNHARGAALAAKLLDMHLTVVVPKSAPPEKKDFIRQLAPERLLRVHVTGDTFDDSLEWALSQHGTTLHPYDNADVVAGQGTVVDDLLAQHPETQHIVLPVGGGGLLAGVLARLEQKGRTDITVYAAQADGSNSLGRSVDAGKLRDAHRPNQRYGGSAVRTIGAFTLALSLRSPNLQLLTVPDDDVAELSELYDHDRRRLLRTKTPNYEPTTLVAVAALKQLTHLDAPVTVLGTGQNDTVYPSATRRRRYLPF